MQSACRRCRRCGAGSGICMHGSNHLDRSVTLTIVHYCAGMAVELTAEERALAAVRLAELGQGCSDPRWIEMLCAVRFDSTGVRQRRFQAVQDALSTVSPRAVVRVHHVTLANQRDVSRPRLPATAGIGSGGWCRQRPLPSLRLSPAGAATQQMGQGVCQCGGLVHGRGHRV